MASQLLCLGLLLTTTLAKPTWLSKRATPVVGDNNFNPTQLKQLSDGFGDAVTLAQAGLAAAATDNTIYKNYFADEDLDTVKMVLNAIIGDGSGGGPLADLTIRSDFPNPDNGNKLSCGETRFFGATRANPDDDQGITILCPPAFNHGGIDKGYDTLDPAGPKAVTCDSVGNTVSAAMDTLGSDLLHEYTHFPALVFEALPQGTDDEFVEDDPFYGPVDARIVKQYGPGYAIQIADVYTWYCNEAFWSAHCDKRVFNAPTDGNDPACDNKKCAEADPSKSDKSTTCDCNEDGCTDGSPGCCGNGTCPKGPSKRDLKAIMERSF